jgi:F0F1-type ATP synthase membrane subunit b/b'
VTFDEQIRVALDRATAAARAHLEADLAAFTDELTRAAVEERSRAAQQAAEKAASEVHRQAEAHIALLREAAGRQAEEIKRAAEGQVGEIRQSLQAQFDEVRRTAQAQVNEARRHADNEIEEARRDAAALVDEARRHTQREIEDARRLAAAQVDDVERRSEERLDEMRRDYEGQIEEARKRGRADLEVLRAEMDAARQSAEAEAEEVVINQLATAQAQADRRVNQAAERTRTDAHQSELAHAASLLEAIRTLDDARALGEVLDALAECAGREVERAAVLLVKGHHLRGWRLTGFPDAGPAKNIELDLDAAGLAGAVVRTGVAVSRPTVAPGDEDGTRQPALPPFALTAGARHAMALPLIVGGKVVAVLYGDAPRLDTPSSSSRWPAVLEILARHSSRALEATTVQQAVGFSLPRPVARASHAALPGPVEHGGSGDEDAARRYARLLLSEIRMYHEPLVDAGRRSRDLRTRLRGEIDRARRLYEARVPPAIREQSDYFEQELVRTLADGDRSLLG